MLCNIDPNIDISAMIPTLTSMLCNIDPNIDINAMSDLSQHWHQCYVTLIPTLTSVLSKKINQHWHQCYVRFISTLTSMLCQIYPNTDINAMSDLSHSFGRIPHNCWSVWREHNFHALGVPVFSSTRVSFNTDWIGTSAWCMIWLGWADCSCFFDWWNLKISETVTWKQYSSQTKLQRCL